MNPRKVQTPRAQLWLQARLSDGRWACYGRRGSTDTVVRLHGGETDLSLDEWAAWTCPCCDRPDCPAHWAPECKAAAGRLGNTEGPRAAVAPAETLSLFGASITTPGQSEAPNRGTTNKEPTVWVGGERG